MTTAREALDMVEARIREQAKAAPKLSMEWRAHMADLSHIQAVRIELHDEAPE